MARKKEYAVFFWNTYRGIEKVSLPAIDTTRLNTPEKIALFAEGYATAVGWSGVGSGFLMMDITDHPEENTQEVDIKGSVGCVLSRLIPGEMGQVTEITVEDLKKEIYEHENPVFLNDLADLVGLSG